jgi:hypothetical protein
MLLGGRCRHWAHRRLASWPCSSKVASACAHFGPRIGTLERHGYESYCTAKAIHSEIKELFSRDLKLRASTSGATLTMVYFNGFGFVKLP